MKRAILTQISARRTGFTLVELLAVIAIIAVLLALIVPGLGRVRRSALTTASLNNLKNIHVITFEYLTETRGVYPVTYESGDWFWRREVWEATYGPFEGGPEQVMEGMQNSPYATVMWCPLMLREHGQDQHPGGRGSYALNLFFHPHSGMRRLGDPRMIGTREPYIMAGTVHQADGRFGTNEQIESARFPYDTYWSNLAYAYGASGEDAIGLYIAGNARQISREDGMALDSALRDRTILE